jgi:hypothetical protein
MMSACVLPIGPDFQDPIASPNYAPVFIDSNPMFGTAATSTSQMLQSFNVRLTDPNVGDNLTVRWIVDFPPFSPNTRLQADEVFSHRLDGIPLDVEVPPFQPNCLQVADIPVHQIMVVVSDRGFVTAQDPTDLTSVPAGGAEIFGNWTLTLDCHSP